MYVLRDHRLLFSYCISFSKDQLVFVNSADPDKCHIMLYFILVFTVYQSARLGIPGLQRDKMFQ